MTLKLNYNKKNKNRIRNEISEIVREYDFDSILTLESKDFLFSKLFPDKKITVYENDAKTYTSMKRNCPKHVELIFANIPKFSFFKRHADFIYLDFCRTWEHEKENIIKMKETIKNCKLFALTICTRSPPQGSLFHGDYQFDLIKNIQEITGVNWKVVYGESYSDGVTMCSFILENPNKSKGGNENGT